MYKSLVISRIDREIEPAVYNVIHVLIDIDECSLGLHSCTQACLNYPGGYFCGCYHGYHTIYQKDSLKAECVGKCRLFYSP